MAIIGLIYGAIVTNLHASAVEVCDTELLNMVMAVALFIQGIGMLSGPPIPGKASSYIH